MNIETKTEVVTQAIKASPPITVGALTISGMPLSEWVLIITLIYTLSQIFFLFKEKIFDKRKIDKGE